MIPILITAACRDPKTEEVVCSWTHDDVHMRYLSRSKQMGKVEYGWVDTNGKFYTKKEAEKLPEEQRKLAANEH